MYPYRCVIYVLLHAPYRLSASVLKVCCVHSHNIRFIYHVFIYLNFVYFESNLNFGQQQIELSFVVVEYWWWPGGDGVGL